MELIYHCLQHVLPKGLHKVRSYGLLCPPIVIFSIEQKRSFQRTPASLRKPALMTRPKNPPIPRRFSVQYELVQKGSIPERSKEDALHIALATVHGMDYLLTWNCRYFANAEMRKDVISVCMSLGYETPVISTPEELMGD